MASGAGLTEKTIATQNQQHQRPQPVLKCPRCDSLNTKFCYYNNYNLSQPRHFCKACKRYWTRGGTLRNVPVGGGCRKNKRIKRSSTFTSTTTNHDTTTASATVSHNHNHNLNPNSNPDYDHHSILSNSNLNPLYGVLQQNPKFPRFNTRVSSANDTDASSRFDFIQPQMSSLGLGFSSSLVSSYPSMFSGGSTSSSTADPSMASLLISSSIHQQQQPGFTGFSPYGDGSCSIVNDIHQMEGTKNNTGWNNSFNSQQVDNDQQIKAVGSSDPASFLWTMIGGDGGEWLDPTSNIGSSVSSLI